MEPKKQRATGIQRLINATGYSIQGLKAAWRHEAAFRQEAVVIALLIPLALWLGTTPFQHGALIFSLMVILMVELLNSAIEAAIDRIGPELHDLSGRAKNLGSAAVMVSIVAAAVVWSAIAWQRWGTAFG